MQASAFAFGTSVGPVSVSATGLFAHAGQRICLWNLCRPGKRQRHRAFCRVSVSATGLFAGWHYVYPAYIVPTACTAVNRG
ncbi:hypothetical protein R3J16_000650 [Enterobacter hormaechei]|uniref:hypothetical protein n=1 Tax=Enterobacter hormaechei TaxID=158836 RepID=UPI002939F8A4|nr:hypothetical protein [Enterobacter hormaechei]